MSLPEGLWVALPTPFGADGTVDVPALQRVVRRVVAGGADVLVPLGTTGEAATLEEVERDAVVAACQEAAAAKPIVVGCGHPATATVARMVRRAHELQADGVLVVTPYYNKPTQDGLVAHYAAAADAGQGLPVVAYNVPGRTGVSLALETLARLWQIDAVVALKESSGDATRFLQIAGALPAGKTLLCGDDHLMLEAAAAGARGLVSVAANVAPEATTAMVRAALSGDIASARRARAALAPLLTALFLESNPIPLKAALALLDVADNHLRLPLTRASAATVAALRAALAHLHEPAESSP